MAFGSGSGSGKKPGYVDLDAPNLFGEDPWDPRSVPAASHRSSGLSVSKKPKKAQNPNRPRKEYADAVREIVLHYYKVRSMEMLQWEFLDGGIDGFLSLCADIGREITDKLEEMELFLGGLCRIYPVVGRISNSKHNECCRGNFRGYTQEDPRTRV